MQCLEGYIGIRYCGASDPPSGRWINDLPGISLESVDKIAGEEQTNFLGVMSDVEKRAIARIKSSSLSYLRRTYNIKQVMDSTDIGKVVGDNIAAEDKWKGFVLSANFDRSEMLAFYVHELNLYSTANVTAAPIKIIDADTKDELYSTTKDLVTGWNKITIKQYFFPSSPWTSIFVAYNNVASKSLTLPYDADEFCSCAYKFICNDCELLIEGAHADSLSGPISKGANTFGLSGIVALRCSYESVICNNLDLFTNAYLYCLGMEFLFERIYSDRLNKFTILKKEQAKEMFADFERDFNSELQLALDSINLEEDNCLVCQAPITERWMKT